LKTRNLTDENRETSQDGAKVVEAENLSSFSKSAGCQENMVGGGLYIYSTVSTVQQFEYGNQN
jgi:hypothetical protein